MSKERFNGISRNLYATVRNTKGKPYSLSSSTGLDRYVNAPFRSILPPPLQQKNVFTGVVKTLRKKGLDTMVRLTSILKEVLDPNNQKGLVESMVQCLATPREQGKLGQLVIQTHSIHHQKQTKICHNGVARAHKESQ